MLVFDCETDGLLDELTRIHCLTICDTTTGNLTRYRRNGQEDTIEAGVRRLMVGPICGHNILSFDIPAIRKVYPWFAPDEALAVDTMVLGRLAFPDTRDIDAKLVREGHLPARLTKKHSLEAWGYRLKVMKGEYDGDPEIEDLAVRKAQKWARWNQAMDDYCVQDVEVTVALLKRLNTEGLTEASVELEHRVQRICLAQTRRGFGFDEKGAAALYGKLSARRTVLEQAVRETFGSRYLSAGEFIPKGANATLGYVPGAALTRVKLTEFNPGSRSHIAEWLIRKYGWAPRQFTPDGRPQVDESVLETLDYPEAKLLTEYLLLQKRIGQLAEGTKAWMRVSADGRIHGGVITNGAVTGRAAHVDPNLGQVPAVGAPYGKECRSLFIAPENKVLMGADLSGIELRCLAHFMARYDNGEYARELLEGDIHTLNQAAAGLTTRNQAKTFIYALLYGAGAGKIGSIIGKGPKAGGQLRTRFLKKLPALGKLIEAVAKASERGYLIGLDGRKLPVRSAHSALNTLLQSAGAIISKKAMVLLDDAIEANGWRDRVHQVAWVHDEFQLECDKEIADDVGRTAVQCMEAAGRHFNFRLPITGEFKVGRNWAETH